MFNGLHSGSRFPLHFDESDSSSHLPENDALYEVHTESLSVDFMEPKFQPDQPTTAPPAEQEASTLLRNFNHEPLTKKKATNAPKHLLRVLYRQIQKLRGSTPAIDAHLEDLEMFRKVIEKQCKNRMHLTKVFGVGETDIEKSRNDINRKLVQKRLAEGKLEDILLNNMIPKNNKLHYLLVCKIYEWRLYDPELVARFQC